MNGDANRYYDKDRLEEETHPGPPLKTPAKKRKKTMYPHSTAGGLSGGYGSQSSRSWHANSGTTGLKDSFILYREPTKCCAYLFPLSSWPPLPLRRTQRRRSLKWPASGSIRSFGRPIRQPGGPPSKRRVEASLCAT